MLLYDGIMMFPILLSLPEMQKRVCVPEHLPTLSSYTNKRYKIQVYKHFVVYCSTYLIVYLPF